MCRALQSECGGKVPGMRPEERMMLEKSGEVRIWGPQVACIRAWRVKLVKDFLNIGKIYMT